MSEANTAIFEQLIQYQKPITHEEPHLYLVKDTLADKLHKDAADTLELVGVECHDRRVIRPLEETGLAGYDDSTSRVYFLPEAVEQAISTGPGIEDFPVPMHSFGGGGVASWVQERDGKVVQPELEKHIRELMEPAAKHGWNFMFKSVSGKYTPEEEEKQIREIRRYYDGYLFMRAETDIGIERCVEEYEDTGKICTTHSILLTPLTFNETDRNLEIFCQSAKKNLPLYLTPMPFAFENAPGSIYGVAVQATAEFYAALCLARAINPDVTVVNGAYPAMTRPGPDKVYPLDLGGLPHLFANYITSQASIRQGLPAIQSGCTISGCMHEPVGGESDEQTNIAARIWNGLDFHMLRHVFGFTKDLAVYSLDKQDDDMRTVHNVLRGHETIPVRIPDLYRPGVPESIAESVNNGDWKLSSHSIRYGSELLEQQKLEYWTQD